MPIYDYRCLECGYEFEKIVFGAESKVVCPECGDDSEKILSVPSPVQWPHGHWNV